ncbi:zinc finger BED domain-containing protein 4-like [Macrobrachium rosenbergii]|uniref:zinc finger BED domain-containing protein 4-like n=1 Tax=Macrobrachium rosenbergii TaxID=79674 RepID=UPI0034D71500
MLGVTHLPCFTHTPNLIVSDGLKCITELHEKCRNVVSYFHRSVKGSETLETSQMQLNVPKHKLAEEVATRWNSTYERFERLIQQEEAVKVAIVRLDNPAEILEKEEWQMLKDLIKILRPFNEVTKELSSEKSDIASKIIPFGRILQASLFRAREPNEDLVKTVITALREPMLKRFLRMNENLTLALVTLLDPRFKTVPARSPSVVINMLRRGISSDPAVAAAAAALSTEDSDTESSSLYLKLTISLGFV